MKKPVLETPRLLLRYPEEQDFEPLAEMMQDEETARFIGGVQEPAITWRNFCSLLGHWQLRGYGFFSVIEKETGDWLGRIGPWYPHQWPQPEVGWTIKRQAWGKGFAPEAASACLDYVFDTLKFATNMFIKLQFAVAQEAFYYHMRKEKKPMFTLRQTSNITSFLMLKGRLSLLILDTMKANNLQKN